LVILVVVVVVVVVAIGNNLNNAKVENVFYKYKFWAFGILR